MYHGHLVVAGYVRVGIHFAGNAVGSPAGMADAVVALEGMSAKFFFQCVQAAGGLRHFQEAMVDHGDAGAVVAAVF